MANKECNVIITPEIEGRDKISLQFDKDRLLSNIAVLANENWIKQKVNINEVVSKFAPDSAGIVNGIKYEFRGAKYTVVADMASGYLRIKDNKTGNYLKLDGTPGNRSETHFKIKKKEEM